MSIQTVQVKETTWAFHHGGPRETVIRAENSRAFINIPMSEARQLVDQVHDICDEYESRLREEKKHDN